MMPNRTAPAVAVLALAALLTAACAPLAAARTSDPLPSPAARPAAAPPQATLALPTAVPTRTDLSAPRQIRILYTGDVEGSIEPCG